MEDVVSNDKPGQDQFDALKLEASILSPKQDSQHKELEAYAGGVFVSMFGELLNQQQREYMLNSSSVVAQSEDMAILLDEFNHPVVRNHEMANIGDRFYYAYGFRSGSTVNQEFPDGERVGGFATPSGVTVVRKLQSEIPHAVGSQALDYERNVEVIKHSKDFKSVDERMDAKFKTWSENIASEHFMKDVVHEKNHGIQSQNIPLPLREAQSYWIQEQVARKNRAPRGVGVVSHGFTKAFDQLYQEFGDDLNRLIWGNIEDKFYEGVLLDQVKLRLTPEFVDAMLPRGCEWQYTEEPQ